MTAQLARRAMRFAVPAVLMVGSLATATPVLAASAPEAPLAEPAREAVSAAITGELSRPFARPPQDILVTAHAVGSTAEQVVTSTIVSPSAFTAVTEEGWRIYSADYRLANLPGGEYIVTACFDGDRDGNCFAGGYDNDIDTYYSQDAIPGPDAVTSPANGINLRMPI